MSAVLTSNLESHCAQRLDGGERTREGWGREEEGGRAKTVGSDFIESNELVHAINTWEQSNQYRANRSRCCRRPTLFLGSRLALAFLRIVPSIMSTSSTDSPAREKCRLAEVLQYKCTLEEEVDGRPTVRCLPVPRIFRMCIHSHPRVPKRC